MRSPASITRRSRRLCRADRKLLPIHGEVARRAGGAGAPHPPAAPGTSPINGDEFRSPVYSGAVMLREILDGGKASVGGWCVVPGSFTAEVMARAGFDWICIDTQHGLIGYDQMLTMLQAVAVAGTPSVVRVPWNHPASLMQALDARAPGVIVPMVNSAAEAAAAVGACRYPPAGYRSWGPTRAALGVADFSPELANRSVICAVMVETVPALDQLA